MTAPQDASVASLHSRIPGGPLAGKWDKHRLELKLVSPANKRKFEIVVVGTGLAGASAAASLAELGYQVKVFCIQDSPRRAHSIAAQGGINASKNYPNDGDSVDRLFLDTIRGGDYRAREANVYRLAQVSGAIIDHCVAQGVPFARDYGGQLVNRSFGGAQVSRTFYARGQTGQQLLVAAYGALMRQVAQGNVKLFPRSEMLELVVSGGAARGIVVRNLIDGSVECHAGHAVVLASGGYGNVFYLSTNSKASNVTAIWRAHAKGAFFANPCFTQIHPTCIPVHGVRQAKLTLMSESLRNDGRVWVPKNAGDPRRPEEIPEDERDYFLERKYPSYGNLVPRDVASRNAKQVCDEGRGVGPSRHAVYLDFSGAIRRVGIETIREKYGNLFDMYERITAEDPYATPMRIYPAIHYTMGGLWVDYNLMSTLPGLFAVGEANFSDHGANRLGASALMQGLADGYFILPYTIGGYLAGTSLPAVSTAQPEFREAAESAMSKVKKLMSIQGRRTPDDFHRELGLLLWNHCGMSRNDAGLRAAKARIPEIRDEFWRNVKISGSPSEFNQVLEQAIRVGDFLEFAELLVEDALTRTESCGCHFREESETPDLEPLRDDANFSHVAAWEYGGPGRPSKLHKEPLAFENVSPTQRSYK